MVSLTSCYFKLKFDLFMLRAKSLIPSHLNLIFYIRNLFVCFPLIYLYFSFNNPDFAIYIFNDLDLKFNIYSSNI